MDAVGPPAGRRRRAAAKKYGAGGVAAGKADGRGGYLHAIMRQSRLPVRRYGARFVLFMVVLPAAIVCVKNNLADRRKNACLSGFFWFSLPVIGCKIQRETYHSLFLPAYFRYPHRSESQSHWWRLAKLRQCRREILACYRVASFCKWQPRHWLP